MLRIKRVIFSLFLMIPLLSLGGCGSEKPDLYLQDIKITDIERVTVSSISENCVIPLTDENATELIKLLKDINKNDIKEYNGPDIKEGPINVRIFMKSNETFNIRLVEENLIFWDAEKTYQVKQVGIKKFVDELFKPLRTPIY